MSLRDKFPTIFDHPAYTARNSPCKVFLDKWRQPFTRVYIIFLCWQPNAREDP